MAQTAKKTKKSKKIMPSSAPLKSKLYLSGTYKRTSTTETTNTKMSISIRELDPIKDIMEGILEKMEDMEKTIERMMERIEELSVKDTKKSETLVIPGEISFEAYKKCFKILGDTKPYKEIIKENGGKWNGVMKCWIIGTTKADIIKMALTVEGVVIKE
jgi:hypothetical protein